MNTLVIVLVAAVCLIAGYVCYGRWLAAKWGIDPKAKTPAVEKEDGEGTELKKKKKGEEIPGKDVEYKSDVDTSKRGIYTVQYSYQAENERLGTTQLIVVVE